MRELGIDLSEITRLATQCQENAEYTNLSVFNHLKFLEILYAAVPVKNSFGWVVVQSGDYKIFTNGTVGSILSIKSGQRVKIEGDIPVFLQRGYITPVLDNSSCAIIARAVDIASGVEAPKHKPKE